MNGLRRGDGRVRVAHGCHGDETTLHDDEGFDAKERWFPQHHVRPLAHFQAAHFMADAVGDGGVDGQLGHVAFHAGVVMPVGVAGQRATLLFHLVGGLPATHAHLTHATHGLRVG